MSLYLSKLISLFVFPLGFALFLIIFGVVISFKSTLLARLSLAAAVALLWSASTPIAADYFCYLLERQYPPVPVEQTPLADAIVVLGGGVNAPAPPRLTADLNSAADRVLHAMRLYRAGKSRLILVSGGLLPWQEVAAPEAETMRALLEEWGVPGASIMMEGASQNTRENALFTKQVMKHNRLKRILLVTSALHMPRALATFKSAGIYATPAPTDFTVTYRDHSSLMDFLPSASSLTRTTDAFNEFIGQVYYRRMGWL